MESEPKPKWEITKITRSQNTKRTISQKVSTPLPLPNEISTRLVGCPLGVPISYYMYYCESDIFYQESMLHTRAVPKVRGHDLIMLFLEYYSNKFFIL